MLYRILRSAALILLSIAGAQGQPAANPPPAPRYFEPEVLLNPQVSPSGKWVAARTRFDDRHYALSLIDPQTRERYSLAQSAGMTVHWFWWKNDDLILFFVSEDEGAATFRSIDLQKRKINNLEDFRGLASVTVSDILPNDPANILIYYAQLELGINAAPSRNDAMHLNVATGSTKVVEPDLGGTKVWFANNKGEVIGAQGQTYFAWREPGKKWQRIEHPKNEPAPWTPWGVAPDQRRFIVGARNRGPNEIACFYDPATGTFEEIAGPAGLDPLDPVRWGIHNEPSVVPYAADTSLRFLNPDAEACYQWLGSLFPGLQVRCVSFSQDNNRIVVQVSNEANPGTYYLADRAQKRMFPIGNKLAGINSSQMSQSRAFEFKSTDGLTVHGWIMSPAGGGKAPLVLMVDPLRTRPEKTFDSRAQFFAAQGYAVAQVYYRGTEGFGRDFAIAGDLQVAGAMGRDLVEGVKWMGEQGWIDPERVALYATGSGGLVAMPLAAQKGVFKAFINYKGVLDVSSWKTSALFYPVRSEEALLTAMGGRRGFETYRKSIDPLAAAGKIAIPSLHVYDRLGNNSFSSEVLKLQSTLKKSVANSEIILGESRKTTSPARWTETVRYYDQIAAFLKKTL